MPIKKRTLFYRFPIVLYAMIIFILSSISHYPDSFPSFFGFDKIIHCIEFYIFGYLVMRVFFTSPDEELSRFAAIFTIVIGILYGISDEFHQWFVPGRYASAYDLLFDSAGVILSVVTYRIVRDHFYPARFFEDRIERLQP